MSLVRCMSREDLDVLAIYAWNINHTIILFFFLCQMSKDDNQWAVSLISFSVRHENNSLKISYEKKKNGKKGQCPNQTNKNETTEVLLALSVSKREIKHKFIQDLNSRSAQASNLHCPLSPRKKSWSRANIYFLDIAILQWSPPGSHDYTTSVYIQPASFFPTMLVIKLVASFLNLIISNEK